ncbi:MAG: RNA polymerase sigma factor [Flavisolibacter sp.]
MSIQEFNSLVLNHSEALRPFAISLTRDQEAARDLCQETLYKAFAYRHHYQSGTNVRAWLYTIMRNIFINDYRREGRKRGVMEEVKRIQTPPPTSSEISIRLHEIHSVIHELPSVLKTVCILYLEGYQYQEIAWALDEPLGTIKSRIHFARKLLQKKLDR